MKLKVPLTPLFTPTTPCAAKLTKFQHDLKKCFGENVFVLDTITYELYEDIREYVFVSLAEKKANNFNLTTIFLSKTSI